MKKGHFSIKQCYMLLISKTIFQGTSRASDCLGPGASGAPLGSVRTGQGLAARAHPTVPAREQGSRGQPEAAPGLGIGQLHGDELRPGWDVSPWVGLRIRPGEGMARQGHGARDGPRLG